MRYLIFVFILFSQISFPMEKMVIRLDMPTPATVTEFTKQNYDIAAYKPGEYLDLVVTQKQADDLSLQGYIYTIAQTEDQLKENLGDIRDLPGYRNYEEFLNELQTLESTYPDLCKLYDIGDTWGSQYFDNGNENYQNFQHEIWALKLSDNVETEEDEPSVYYLAEHHAREPISLEVVMAILYHLIDGYGSDSDITSRVNNNQIWFVPLVNPNGHSIVTTQTDTWWRKNIRDNNENGSFDTYNSGGYGIDGVDLNRNYGFEWGPVGTSDEFDSPVYHGPEPWSEPEVDAVRELLESHQFISGITYHSYSELVLYPFGYQNDAIAPDQVELQALAIAMAETIPGLNGGYYTPSAGYDLYPCMGTTDDYSYGVHGTFSYTIELGTQFIPPVNEIDDICQDNIEAAMILLDRSNTKVLTGQITDASTGEPIVAEIFIDGIDNTGMFRYPYKSEPLYGRYYRFLPNENYSVRFTANGYFPIVVDNIAINPFDQTILDISMEPAQEITLSGQVLDGASGLPLENVSVELVNSQYDPVVTNEEGSFTIENILENVYVIQFQIDGYSTLQQEIFATVENNEFIFHLYPSVVESFESGDFSDDWSFNGQADWQVVNVAFDGNYSARSGSISDSQISEMTFTSDTNSNEGMISFYLKTSSEASYDFLLFYVDDVLLGQWSGETDWTLVSFPVTVGSHIYRWSYEKDTFVSGGEDCAWIDYINFPWSNTSPDIFINPTSIDIELETDQTVSSIITLSNIGGGIVEYQSSVSEDISSISGEIPPYQSSDLTLTIDAQGLNSGNYSGYIHLLTNDPDEPSIYINVSVTVVTGFITVEVDVNQGWNLVSLPVTTDQTDVLSIFPNAISETLYKFENGYIQQDSMNLGEGYWLRFNESEQSSINGDQINSLPIFVSEGWNLIGGISTEVSSSMIVDPDSILIPNTMYGFDNLGYLSSDLLIPGHGYWIRAYENGEIIITDGITLVDESSSGCLNLDREVSLEIVVDGNMITLLYSHSDLNCCLETDWNGWLSDNTFFVEMNDIGPPCDCNCPFDLSATFGPFDPGTYILDFLPDLFGNPTFVIEGSQTRKAHSRLNKLISNGVELLFGETELSDFDKLQYSLPPKPPAGALDIRFNEDTRLCNSDECVLEIQSDQQSFSFEIEINDNEHWELIPWNEKLSKWGNVITLDNMDQFTVDHEVSHFILRKTVSPEIPNIFSLNPAFPNPFNAETTISFTLPDSDIPLVTFLEIYDITGRLVETLLKQKLQSGYHVINWNASEVSSGVYFSVLQNGADRLVTKMLLLK